MAFSENLASLEPWTVSSIADLWGNELFNRETETLTKALQRSLSPDSGILAADTDENTSFHRINLLEPAPAASASDAETSSKPQIPISDRKISKRKSRVTKRSSTTFIAADPENFRQMVQQVTGKRFSDSFPPVAQVLKPEPQRPGDWLLQNCRLPTLDTSALLLDQKVQTTKQSLQQQKMDTATTMPERHVSFATVTGGSAGFDFEKLQSFPTLDSWGRNVNL